MIQVKDLPLWAIDTYEPTTGPRPKPTGPLFDWQTVAEMAAATGDMETVVHDVGPLDIYGNQTFLDIQIEEGLVRLSSSDNDETSRTLNRAGYIYCIELALGVPGHLFAEALREATLEIPQIVAGFADDDYGMSAGLTTKESADALARVHAAMAALRPDISDRPEVIVA